MEYTIIDGKGIAQEIKNEIAIKVSKLTEQEIVPTLAVVLVGSDPASMVYVANKKKACEQTGIVSLSYELPVETTEEELLKLIDTLNNDKKVHGILVQLPLPPQIDEKKVIPAILPEKDVDGFHPYNIGLLETGMAHLKPCTPAGVIELLKRSGISIEGKKCVVVGRSNIVGKPVSTLLLAKNGTVTVTHSKTKNLLAITKEADLLIVALGKPRFITPEMIKEGAVVIDVGIHRIDGKLCGDVDFERCKEKTSYITKVPGGVGPMTIAMLMQNCLTAAQAQSK